MQCNVMQVNKHKRSAVKYLYSAVRTEKVPIFPQAHFLDYRIDVLKLIFIFTIKYTSNITKQKLSDFHNAGNFVSLFVNLCISKHEQRSNPCPLILIFIFVDFFWNFWDPFGLISTNFLLSWTNSDISKPIWIN